ncbi:hypothetical protein MKW98_003149 [Papaver atlanticum]|uniref:pyruvate decarboxylase n=1 Tax=Papaver atlanticum TaxID=357466 RepID=A0AAD4TET1_9MAGN|nr:hypothetical protein MKW98_003149 [Papaver atlanticum]
MSIKEKWSELIESGSNLSGLNLGGDIAIYCDLLGNHLSGQIPDEIGECSSLQTLDLSFNEIYVDIPFSVSKLKELETLILNSNQLIGPIPSTLSQIPNLKILDLAQNMLSGEIPRLIYWNEVLQYLGLRENNLVGSLSSDICQLTGLWFFDARNNSLTGSIPMNIGNCTGFQVLDPSYNQLTGEIPFNIGFLQVATLSLQGNKLTGQIPSVVGLMQALAVLDLSCNLLSGPIPPILGNLTYTEKLYLHSNKLTGSIPPLVTVSTAFCAEILESAYAYIFARPIFNDYSSVGYSLLLKKEKAIIMQPDRVVIANGPAFGCVLMKKFLPALAKKLQRNTTAYENYRRIYVPEGLPPQCDPKEQLRVNILFKHIQKMLSGDSAVIAETGDSWFNCQKLKLPEGCGYEFQMQYGSIGWSVGATLGYAQAAKDKRVIACIGDGSFQVTAKDISTMLRCEKNTIFFLINNGGYTIEVEIHDGPYNVIKNWNYTALVDAIHNGDGKCWTTKVQCEEELVEAIETETEVKKDCLCFIEIVVHRDETSKELLEWGSRVSSANNRPPNPHWDLRIIEKGILGVLVLRLKKPDEINAEKERNEIKAGAEGSGEAAEHKHIEIDEEKEKSEVEVGAEESEESWHQMLELFKEQALKMQDVSQEAYELYSKRVAKNVDKVPHFFLGILYGIRFGTILGGALLALSILSMGSFKRGRSSALAFKGEAGMSQWIIRS